jgi:hypothetical protein
MSTVFKTAFPFNMFHGGVPLNLVVAFMVSCILYRYTRKIPYDKGVFCFILIHTVLSAFYKNFSDNQFMFYEIINLYNMCTYEMYISNWKTKVTSKQPTSKQPTWLNIEIKHGGNQNIPEFADGKSIHFEMSETKTINDLKKEIELKVKNAPKENQSLHSTIFGESYHNHVKLGDISVHSLNTLQLFIVLRDY